MVQDQTSTKEETERKEEERALVQTETGRADRQRGGLSLCFLSVYSDMKTRGGKRDMFEAAPSFFSVCVWRQAKGERFRERQTD